MGRRLVTMGLAACVTVALAACGAQVSQAPQSSTKLDVDVDTRKSLDQIPESKPADSGATAAEPTGMDVVDDLQGWWIDASESGQALPAYVFEGPVFYVMQGNGRDESQTHTIVEADITRGEQDGVPGWRISLGDSTLFVPEHDQQSPVLTTKDAHITLARGEGDLF